MTPFGPSGESAHRRLPGVDAARARGRSADPAGASLAPPRTARFTVLALLVSACAVTPLRVATTPGALDPRELAGTWHVVGTTFPMWLDGKKQSPRFRYSNVRVEDGLTRFDDEVSFVEDGKPGHILGVDTQAREVPTHFTWRGKGLLALFVSEWDVAYLHPSGSWAIITFSKTLATPAGLDVISRRAEFNGEDWVNALLVIDAEPELKKLSEGLKRLPLTPTLSPAREEGDAAAVTGR